MNVFFFILFSAQLLLLGAPIAEAQAESNATALPEKSDPVRFPIDCSPNVQAAFNRGVALLFAFAPESAEQIFLAVTAADPDCAMGYWGAALSQKPLLGEGDPKRLKKGFAFSEKAKTLSTKNVREQGYIDAVKVLFENIDTVDTPTRILAHQGAMAQLQAAHPDDQNAAVFYALSLLAGAASTDEARTNREKAESILRAVLEDSPHHPGALHAMLLVYDTLEGADRGLPFARRYVKIAPSTPQALHLPAHLFMHLGLWQEAIASNRIAETAARSKMGSDSGMRLHLLDDLVYLYLQVGEDGKAEAIVNEILAMPPSEAPDRQAAYARTAIPARYVMERRLWKGALSLRVRPNPYPDAEAATYFAYAIGGSRSRRPLEAAGAVEGLRSLHNRLRAAKAASAAEGVEILLQAAAGWIEYAEGKRDRAMLHLRAAAEIEERSASGGHLTQTLIPAREMLGDLLLEEGEPKAALREYERSLARKPNRFNTLYGAARAAERAEEIEKARDYYQRMVALAEKSESRQREILEATLFLEKTAPQAGKPPDESDG